MSPMSEAVQELQADRERLLARAARETREVERKRLVLESNRLGVAIDRLLLGIAIQAAIIASKRFRGARSRRA